MALTLPIITAGYAGSRTNRANSLPLPGAAIWTERNALPTVTTKKAPDRLASDCNPVFTVIFPVDTIICIGAAPDTGTGAIYFVPALTEKTYYAEPGDKLAAAASA